MSHWRVQVLITSGGTPALAVVLDPILHVRGDDMELGLFGEARVSTQTEADQLVDRLWMALTGLSAHYQLSRHRCTHDDLVVHNCYTTDYQVIVQ